MTQQVIIVDTERRESHTDGMKEKITVPAGISNRLINSGPVVLVTATNKNSTTISTIAWQMPVSKEPPLAAISISAGGYLLELILAAGEFCINVPDHSLLDKVLFCGSRSGRNVDKFSGTGLTPVRCKKLSTFYIDECMAHIECGLEQIHPAGDHKIIVGSVLSSYCDSMLLNDDGVIDIERFHPINHLGGTHFGILKPVQTSGE